MTTPNSGKKNSITLTEGPNRAAARSYFRSVGFSREDLSKPIIGIANTWTEIGPCNFHLRDVAAAVKQGVRDAGGTPMEFNTVTIHDGITMGTEGMKASLISREVIADSRELVSRGNSFDGLVCIAGCDKNMPAAIMALARLDIPGLMLYGGSIAPGRLRVGPDGKPLTSLSSRPDPERAKRVEGAVEGPPSPTSEPSSLSSFAAGGGSASPTTPSREIDITILQVFEGMGSHAAGKDHRRRARSPRSRRLPRPRCLRRTVHRQHHGHGRRVPRHLPHEHHRRPRYVTR